MLAGPAAPPDSRFAPHSTYDRDALGTIGTTRDDLLQLLGTRFAHRACLLLYDWSVTRSLERRAIGTPRAPSDSPIEPDTTRPPRSGSSRAAIRSGPVAVCR